MRTRVACSALVHRRLARGAQPSQRYDIDRRRSREQGRLQLPNPLKKATPRQ